MAKVVLDAGHGGNDLGMVSGHRYEKNDNLDLIMAIGEILKNNNVDVVYTRDADRYISPVERVKTANAENADLYVTVHRNHSPITGALDGVRGFVNELGGSKEEAAYKILCDLAELGFRNTGVSENSERIDLTDTNMPAILLDIGYINSNHDNEIFDTKFQEIAQVIASGIMSVLGVEENETTAAPDQQNRIEEKSLTKYEYTYCNNCRSYLLTNQENSDNGNRYYSIQVGLFRVYDNAVNLQQMLLRSGYQSQIVDREDFYAVHVGYFENIDDAASFERMLRLSGYNTLLVAVEQENGQ